MKYIDCDSKTMNFVFMVFLFLRITRCGGTYIIHEKVLWVALFTGNRQLKNCHIPGLSTYIFSSPKECTSVAAKRAH